MSNEDEKITDRQIDEIRAIAEQYDSKYYQYDIIDANFLYKNQMKAIEVTGTLDEKGQLSLDQPIENFPPSRVRVIVLFPEVTEEPQTDPDDTPIEEVKASLRRALKEAKAGQRIPLSEMWEGIDVE
mgnify:CR=1 FL=1